MFYLENKKLNYCYVCKTFRVMKLVLKDQRQSLCNPTN